MIEKISLVTGRYYLGTCRNTKIAMWDGNNFIFINYNFNQPYIETINYFGDVINKDIDGFIPIDEIMIDFDKISKEKSNLDYNNSARKIYQNLNPNNLKGEIWKDIIGFSGYQVSNLGRVKKLIFNLIMKQNYSRNYLVLGLNNDNNIRKTLRVHRLVAEAFCENPKIGKYEINHINGVTSDNRATNLEYVSHRENSKKNFTSGNYSFKLTPDIVIQIKDLLKSGKIEQKEIAKKFNVSPSTISEIKTGKKWADI